MPRGYVASVADWAGSCEDYLRCLVGSCRDGSLSTGTSA